MWPNWDHGTEQCMMTADEHGGISKNFTFSVQTYLRKHLCQKGRDSIIQEPLYEGTYKGTEGYMQLSPS